MRAGGHDLLWNAHDFQGAVVRKPSKRGQSLKRRVWSDGIERACRDTNPYETLECLRNDLGGRVCALHELAHLLRCTAADDL